MRRSLPALGLAAALGACAFPPQRRPETVLFDQLGGMPGIERIVSGVVDRSVSDPRTA